MQAIDVFALPSLSEGFPLTIMEAHSLGLKCLVSDQVPKKCNVTGEVKYLSVHTSPEEAAWELLVLKDKKVIVSLTAGAPKETYNDIDDFLNPIKASCKLCQMEYVGSVVTYGVSYQLRNEKGKEIEEKAIDHANRLIEMLENHKK